ncbi:MAG: SUMF1/EgtB/PvdO family nonheme iron enzyme [Treponema sp.]|nr:SUMF1/EgtB/PvdO family nonheme iron enzyme [Treponema sp.]
MNTGKKLLILLAVASVAFTTCYNPIMERWWEEGERWYPRPPGNGNGGGGANFGVVRFDSSGGSPEPRDLPIAWGGVVGRLLPMTRGNDGFVGWFDENDRIWQVESRGVRPEDDVNGDGFIVLKAKWAAAPVSHTVNFEAAPSTVAVASQTIADRGRVVEPVNPIAGDGRSFAGWHTEDGTDEIWGRLWDFANDPVIGPMTLYARWSSYQTRTVVLQVNGGTRANGIELTRTHFTIPVSFGVIQDPGPLVREGHSFEGWFTDLSYGRQWNFNTDRVQIPDAAPGVDPMYLYAKWVPNIYFVFFDTHSVDASQPPRQEVAYGERAFRPTVSNPGKFLVGWFRDWELTDEWNFDMDLVFLTRTLHAKWEDAVYDVNFELRMPSGNAAHPQPEQQRVVHGGKALEPFMPALAPSDRTSWAFLRWDYSGDDSGTPASFLPWNFADGINADITLYARWVRPNEGMVWVPRGSFVMGDSGVSGSPAVLHSYPTRVVTVDGFYLGRHQVTQELFAEVMEGNTYTVSRYPSQFQAGVANRPVERVSWYDALAFANAFTNGHIGLQEVYTLTGVVTGVTMGITNITGATVTVDWNRDGFRLPTEAEWEFAARGGHGSPGNFTHAGSNVATDVAWFTTNAGSQTHPVGTRAPNALGLFDMSGNVSEWCWDPLASYREIIDQPTIEAYDNPRGPASGTERIRRGGSWNNAVGNVRSVVRNSATPGSANWVIGFRLARSPGDSDIY